MSKRRKISALPLLLIDILSSQTLKAGNLLEYLIPLITSKALFTLKSNIRLTPKPRLAVNSFKLLSSSSALIYLLYLIIRLEFIKVNRKFYFFIIYVTCKSKFPHDMEFTFTKYTLFVYGIY